MFMKNNKRLCLIELGICHLKLSILVGFEKFLKSRFLAFTFLYTKT